MQTSHFTIEEAVFKRLCDFSKLTQIVKIGVCHEVRFNFMVIVPLLLIKWGPPNGLSSLIWYLCVGDGERECA